MRTVARSAALLLIALVAGMFVLLPSSSGSAPPEGTPVLSAGEPASSTEHGSPAPTPAATNAPVQVPDAPVEYGTPAASAEAPVQPVREVVEHRAAPAPAAAPTPTRPAAVAEPEAAVEPAPTSEPEAAAQPVSSPEPTPATEPADTARTASATSPATPPVPVDTEPTQAEPFPEPAPQATTQPEPAPQPEPEPARGPYTAADHAYQQNPGTAPQPPGSWVENPAGSWPRVSPAGCSWPFWISPDGYCVAPDGSGDEKD